MQQGNIQIVVLNTNLYYTSNSLTTHMPDPANQLQWLHEVLVQAANKRLKVWMSRMSSNKILMKI